jgi:hypothetical protein
MRSPYFHAIGSKTVRRRAAPQPVLTRYKLLEIERTSLRLPSPQPEATHGTGTTKCWQPRTPAMAAGLTDHVWTLREMLLFRVPPWPQPAGG